MKEYENQITSLTSQILQDNSLTQLNLKDLVLQLRSKANQIEKLFTTNLGKVKKPHSKLEPLHLAKTVSESVNNTDLEAEKVQYMTPQGVHSMDYPSMSEFGDTDIDDMEEDDFDIAFDGEDEEEGGKTGSGFFCGEDIKSARPKILPAKVPVNLIEGCISADLLPIFSLYSQKIVEYSRFGYAPSLDMKDFNPLMEGGDHESVELGDGIYYSGELDIFGQPQNRGFWIMNDSQINKYYIGEFLDGNFHGKGILLTVSHYSWIFENEDFYGFSLPEIKLRAKQKKESTEKDPVSVYFNIFEGEWRDGDIIKGSVVCYKNLDNNEMVKKHGLNRAIAENSGLITPDLTYTGGFKHFMPHETQPGTGIQEWKDKSSYTGTFLNGKRSGKGTFISAFSKECYEGDFKNNQRNGEGYCMYSDGS